MQNTNDILDARQAAQYLKINEQTIRRLARQKKIPAFRVGGVWRFNKSSLDHWAQQQHLSPGSRNVMVIDDEAAIREIVRRILEGEGFSVTTASGGRQALELMQQHLPDLVLLDLRMPGMDGATVLKEIRRQWGKLPVVILTGYPETNLMKQVLKYSPVTLLTKPFQPEQIIETVQTLLKRPGASMSR